MPEDIRNWPTPESTGIDKAYEKARPKALAELSAQMAGPGDPVAFNDDTGIKNPNGEFEHPAPFIGSVSSGGGEGPNGAGNSSGRGDIDPQGQQGGTQGGQPAKPSLPNEVHPIANEAARASHDRTRA